MENVSLKGFVSNIELLGNDLFDKVSRGEMIGEGMSRRVYEINLTESVVLKVAKDSKGIQDNRDEYRIWQIVSDYDEESKWFAPSLLLSECGEFLIQARTEKPKESILGNNIPVFFEDAKAENWGLMYDDDGISRLVCHDYTSCLYKFAFLSLQTTKTMQIRNGYFF